MNRKPQQEETTTVLERLTQYLKQRDFNLEYSDDRMKLFEALDNDPVLIEYISSDLFKNKQVKKKKDDSTEQDPVTRVLDSIAYYILKSDYRNKEHEKEFKTDKSGKVLNNVLENNKAYKRDYRIKEHERIYGYPIMSKYAMNRNRSDNFNTGKNKIRELFVSDYVSQRYPRSLVENEAEAFDLITGSQSVVYSSDFDVYSRLIYALKEPKNVLLFFRYEYEALSEVSGYVESDVRLVSYVLDDIVEEVIESDMDKFIIQCLKDGMGYQQIKKELNREYKENYTYEMVRYRINDILQRISNEIKNKIKFYT